MTPHDRIRRIVERDLQPVRPLLAPGRRVAIVLPIAAALAIAAATRYGLRVDSEQLGGIITWGFSAAQWTLGLLILALALRQAIPGAGVSRRLVATAGIATVAAILTITTVTYAAHPTFVPAAHRISFWYLCFLGPLEFGAPLLVLASLLSARAFPTRPAVTGALCGLAAGVIADSGWRLTCWVTAPAHVLGAHTLAIASLAAAGACLGALIDALRK